MEEVEKRKNKIFKNKYLLILIGILLFAFVLRLIYFNIDQAEWWDAADYLQAAKKFAGIAPYHGYEINPRRPFFMPLFWAGILKLGLGETGLRFTILLFSIFGVWLTYLIGREMFDKKIGLVAAFMMSVFWMHLFFTARLLLDLPAATIWSAAVYFFWKGYIKKEKAKYVWLSGLFIGLGIFTKATSFLGIIILLIFLLIVDRLRFLKNKQVWAAILIALIVISPFIIYVQSKTGHAFKKITGFGEGRLTASGGGIKGFSGIIQYSKFFDDYLTWPYLIIFIIGFYIFFNLFIGFDLLIKRKEEKLNAPLFLFLWIAVFLLFFGVIGGGFEERYLMYIFPAVFIVAANGLIKVYDLVKRYNKHLSVAIISIILIAGGVLQLVDAHQTIKVKQSSYYQVKLAGLWLKQVSDKDDVIISQSNPQIAYYSERDTYGYGDIEKDFEELLKKVKPRYMMISVFEPHPEWAFSYPERHKDKWVPVQAYFADQEQKQAILIIYEHIGENY